MSDEKLAKMAFDWASGVTADPDGVTQFGQDVFGLLKTATERLQGDHECLRRELDKLRLQNREFVKPTIKLLECLLGDYPHAKAVRAELDRLKNL